MKILLPLLILLLTSTNCYAVTTVQEILGFETGETFGVDAEASSAPGVLITNSVSRPHTNENFVLRIDQAKTGNKLFIAENTWPEDSGTVAAVYVQFKGIFPPSATVPNIDFLSVESVTPKALISVRLKRITASVVRLVIVDANGTEVANSSNNPVAVDTWYRIELWFGRGEDHGAILHVNGVEEISVLNQDFDDGNGGNMRLTLKGQGGTAAIGDPTTVYFASAYVLNGAADEDDFLGNYEVRSYSPDAQGLTALMDETGSLPGDNLDSGDWADASDDDTATSAKYTSTGVGGAVICDGPKDTIGSATTIWGAKWIHRVRLTKPFPISAEIIYGSSIGVGKTSWDVATITSSAFFNYINTVSDVTDSKCPLYNEWFAIGIWASGDSGIKLIQGWTYLLMTGNPPAYDGVKVHLKGGHIKGGFIK